MPEPAVSISSTKDNNAHCGNVGTGTGAAVPLMSVTALLAESGSPVMLLTLTLLETAPAASIVASSVMIS